MTNLILQHFDGELRPLDIKSMENIQEYAVMVDADYKLITGKPLDKRLTAPCQKVYMIAEEFDEYDQVLMLDIDMFAPKGMTENIFDVKGCGMYNDVQKMLHRKLCAAYPMMGDMSKPYWGGAIYKFDRNTRQRFRQVWNSGGDNYNWMQKYNQPYHFEDEGIFHTLTVYGSMYFPDHERYVPNKWCQCSFLPNPEKAGFIHIRTKVTPEGPKRDKMLNYEELVQKGIL